MFSMRRKQWVWLCLTELLNQKPDAMVNSVQKGPAFLIAFHMEIVLQIVSGIYYY